MVTTMTVTAIAAAAALAFRRADSFGVLFADTCAAGPLQPNGSARV